MSQKIEEFLIPFRVNLWILTRFADLTSTICRNRFGNAQRSRFRRLTKSENASIFSGSERWQSGRMRIIANDVSLSKATAGSNPALSA